MTETEYIKMLMENLHCTEDAARDVMETDRAIDAIDCAIDVIDHSTNMRGKYD